MSKKILTATKYSNKIVESYQPIKDQDSPILGTFRVDGMTVENKISQNSTRYSKAVWESKNAFAKGGKFIDESGKLRPSSLFGSLDHPLDDRAQFRLEEGAIVWHDVIRNDNGSWDGTAHIMNTPQGRIVKTFLEYAKRYGGGELLGVSSRALGDTITRVDESTGIQFEDIDPDGFDLQTFDFVYNPSFQTAVATLTESVKNKKTLVESIKNLANEDEEHKAVYEEFADKLKETGEMKKKTFEGKSIDKAKQTYLKELKAKAHELYNAIYELENMEQEDFAKAYGNDKDKETIIKNMKADHKEVSAEIEKVENPVIEKPKLRKEAASDLIDDYVDGEVEELNDDNEGLDDEEVLDDEEDLEDDENQEDESEEDDIVDEDLIDVELDGEVTLESLSQEIVELKDMIKSLLDTLAPIEDPEVEFGEEDLEDLGDDDTNLEDVEDESEEDKPKDEDELLEELGLTEEELDSLSDEELEYLLQIAEESE